MAGSPASPTPETLLAQVEWVRRLAASLVAGGADADDVAQETWLRALQHPPEERGRARHWFAIVARNVARQLRRGDERRIAREQRVPLAAPAPSAAELVERAQLQRRVVDALLALDEPYRATLLRRYFEHETPSAIAAHDGVPLDTVKTRLKRGLERLRVALERERESLALWVGMPMGGSTPAAPSSTSSTPLEFDWSPIVASKASIVAVAGVLLGVGAIAWQLADPGERPGISEAAAGGVETAAGDAALPDAVEALRVGETAMQGDRDDATGAEAPPEAAPPSAGDGTALEGIVVDTGGAAVVGATLVLGHEQNPAFRSLSSALAAWESLANVVEGGNAPRRVTTSGADGRFRFDSVAPLAAELRPLVLLAVEPDVGALLARDLDRIGAYTPDGLRLALLSGTRVTGRITDANGLPLEGARVEIDGFDAENVATAEFGMTVANLLAGRDGTYRTIALPFAAFELSSAPPGPRDQRTSMAARSPRTAAPPGTRELRLDLALPAVRVVRGALRSADGVPLAEALAGRFRPEQLARSDQEQFGVFGWSQDPRRNFGLLDGGSSWVTILNGAYDVAAESYQLKLTDERCTHLAVVARKRLLAWAPLPDGVLGPDLVIDAGAIRSAIAPARVRVRVVAEGGASLAGARATALIAARDGQWTTTLDTFAAVDAEGFARIEGTAGEWTLAVERKGGLSDRVTLLSRPGDELDCTLRWCATHGSWRGRVVDAGGAPIAGARVRLVRRSADGWTGTSGDDVDTDRAGAFELPWLEDEASAVIWHADFAPVVVATPSRSDAATAPIVLELGVPVSLRAVDRAGGDVGTARLRLLTAEGIPLIDDLDASGPRFGNLESRSFRLLPGDYRAEAWAVGYAPNEVPLTVGEGATATLALDRLGD